MYSERLEGQLKACGKRTIVLRDNDNNFYYSLYKCKSLECPSCSQVILQILKDKLSYYIYEYNMYKFFTITTRSDYSKLISFLNGLNRRLKELNKDYYIKRRMSRDNKFI